MKNELSLDLHPLTKRKFWTESYVTDCNLWDRAGPLFDARLIEQFRMNVYYFAELLFRWQMYSKRLELLKAVTQQDISPSSSGEPHTIGLFFGFENISGNNFRSQVFIAFAPELVVKVFFRRKQALVSTAPPHVPCHSVRFAAYLPEV